jgi:deazaflavin-dependent oxidoreductase (nitroreductase family)
MANPVTTAAPLKSNVPSLRVLHIVNPIVSLILRSPLHRIVSGSLLLLTFTGRKSGRQFTTPVGYMRDGDGLLVFTDRMWWENLRGGAPVSVLLRGHRQTASTKVITDRAAVVATIERLAARLGAKDAYRLVGITLADDQSPSHEDLMAAMEGHVVIHLNLDA